MKYKEVTFESLFKEDLRNGLTKPKSIRGTGVKMVSMGEIFKYNFIANQVMDLVPISDKEWINTKLEKYDLLFARQSLTLEGAGKCSIITDDEEKVFESHLIRVRLDKDKVDPRFYYYFFASSYGKKKLSNITEQVAAAGIRGSDLKKITVPFPNIRQQNQIADFLYLIDKKINLNDQLNNNLEEYCKLLFKRWFIEYNFDNNLGAPYIESGGLIIDGIKSSFPIGWKEGCLQDIVDFSNGYAFKSTNLLDNESEDTYRVFKMGHIIKGGGLNKSGTKSYVDKSACIGLDKFLLKKGDLLMCMTDMKNSEVALLGHTALMDEDHRYIVNQRVGLLRVRNRNKVNYPYLYCLTNSFEFLEDLRSRANSGVQVNLSSNEIKNSYIVIPEPRVHEKFNAIAEPIFEKIFSNMQQNEKLSMLREFLLPKLMMEEIDLGELSLEQ